MELDDLCFALGLASCRSDLQHEGMKFEEEELFRMFAKGTVSANLIHISDFKMNS